MTTLAVVLYVLGGAALLIALVGWLWTGAKRWEDQAIAGDKRIRDELAERRRVNAAEQVRQRVRRAEQGGAA